MSFLGITINLSPKRIGSEFKTLDDSISAGTCHPVVPETNVLFSTFNISSGLLIPKTKPTQLNFAISAPQFIF